MLNQGIEATRVFVSERNRFSRITSADVLEFHMPTLEAAPAQSGHAAGTQNLPIPPPAPEAQPSEEPSLPAPSSGGREMSSQGPISKGMGSSRRPFLLQGSGC